MVLVYAKYASVSSLHIGMTIEGISQKLDTICISIPRLVIDSLPERIDG